MIISKVERITTIIVAVLMMCAASAYLYMVETVGLPAAGYYWTDLTVVDLVLVTLPSVLLITYAVLLLMFYRQRGVRVPVIGYMGNKFPWM